MVGKLIIRGLLAGIIAGVLAFAFAYAFGEPSVRQSIAFEEQIGAREEAASIAAGNPPAAEEPEIVSRDTQETLGLATGTIGIGAGLGALFGVLFAFAYGRLGNMGPGATAVTLAVIGLVTVYIVPGLKYPANPPASTNDDTVALRTGTYFLMMALSVAATVIGLLLRKRLVVSLGNWNGTLAAAGLYLALVAAGFFILPEIVETPDDFKARTMWEFRMASLGVQTILWIGIGVIFGTVSEMAAKRKAA
jgi:hypothetical protein